VVKGSNIFINAGVGYGILPYKMSLPPISASVEYGLANIPLSIGGYFGYTAYDEELSAYSSYKGTIIGVGTKANWHFNFVRNLDPYISVTLGWLIYKQEVTTTIPYVNTKVDVENDLSAFFYGVNLGARYFFTNNIGAYIEFGYSAISVASAGLTVKF
jgi:hypothetical protein